MTVMREGVRDWAISVSLAGAGGLAGVWALARSGAPDGLEILWGAGRLLLRFSSCEPSCS